MSYVTKKETLKVNIQRLMERIEALSQVGATDSNGCCRIAATDSDKLGRDLVVSWMRGLDLDIHVDEIGNVFGIERGHGRDPVVMMGSHIDTVGNAGKLDGCLGVLAGLEVIESLREAGMKMPAPLAVGFFTNEEGVRYTPDMMGSAVFAGLYPLANALNAAGNDGTRLGSELQRIGYCGNTSSADIKVAAYVELHIEQGPVLERKGITIGAVDKVQGISWTQFTLKGMANHAGTTPLSLRHDAGYVAAEIACYVRKLCHEMGGDQVGTVGRIEFTPNLINVIPSKVVMTVDLRNTDGGKLKYAKEQLALFVQEISARENVEIEAQNLVNLDPVIFSSEIVSLIENTAADLGYQVMRMPSGAGHDAQMMAAICPAAMIFVPSIAGISHNPRESTKVEDIECGAMVLLHTIVQLASRPIA